MKPNYHIEFAFARTTAGLAAGRPLTHNVRSSQNCCGILPGPVGAAEYRSHFGEKRAAV